MDESTMGRAQQETTVRDQDLASSEQIAETESTKKQEIPSYDWHRRVMADSKKAKSQLTEANERLKAFEERDMETNGQHQELIQSLRSENQKLKQEVTQRDEVYTWAQVESDLKSAALKNGCTRPEHLLRLVDTEILRAIQVDENYKPVKEDVDRVIDTVKSNTEYSYLFKTNAHSIDSVTPINKLEKDDPNDLSKMSREQKLQMLSSVLK